MKVLNYIFQNSLFLLFVLALSVKGCRWTDLATGSEYNFAALNRPEGWKVVDKSMAQQANLFNIDYIFNFCEPVRGATCNGKSNIAVYETLEVLGQITDACEVVGASDRMSVAVGTNSGKPGVRITYGGGEVCAGSENPSENGQAKKATFNIVCAPHTDGAFAQLDGNSNTITKCSPEFVINSPAGCIGGEYGGGYGIFFWIIVIMVLYFVIGTLYNIKYKGYTGVEAIPHIAFLKQLPGYIINVIQFIVARIKELLSGKGGSPSSSGLTTVSKTAQYTVV